MVASARMRRQVIANMSPEDRAMHARFANRALALYGIALSAIVAVMVFT